MWVEPLVLDPFLSWTSCYAYYPLQIVICLTFFTPNLITHLIKKIYEMNVTFLLWFAFLLRKALEE